MTSQTKLIRALQDPETQERAFEGLVSTYKERLYWHIRKIVIDHEDANDVIQNTFIKIYMNINRFQGQSKIFTWMYRIATNEALSFIKKKATKLGLTNESWIEAKASGLVADSYFEGDEASLALQKAIAVLPEKQRLIFNMKYFDDLKYETISEILDTSVGALKASYHHATQKIKKHLSDETL